MLLSSASRMAAQIYHDCLSSRSASSRPSSQQRVGEFDGNKVATDGSDGSLDMYGPNADALFAAARPILLAAEFMRGARVTLRYGPPEDGVKEVEVVLGV